MKYYYIVFAGVFFLQSSYADSVDTKLEYDKVSIGYIPSRTASYKGEPHTTLESRTSAHYKNKEIERFFIELNKLATEGISDNATQFHQPTKYIEAIYQGKRVSLYFSGDSKLDKFGRYEKQWKLLHGEVYKYLNNKISPNNQFNSNGVNSTPPVN